MKKAFIYPATAALALVASANTTVFEFNSDAELDSNFTATGSDKWSVPGSNTDGLNGSSALRVSAANSQGDRVYNTPFSSTATSFSVSIFFEFDPVVTEVLNGAGVTLGFGSSSTWVGDFGAGNPGDNQFMVGLTGPNGSAGQRRLHGYYLADGVNASDNSGVTDTLVAGNWYQMELAATNNQDGTFDITSTLYNASSSGVVGSVVQSNTREDYANADWAGGANVYAFFGGQGASDNRIGLNYDNFALTVVPEPSAYALLAGALALSAIAMRRRQ